MPAARSTGTILEPNILLDGRNMKQDSTSEFRRELLGHSGSGPREAFENLAKTVKPEITLAKD